MAFARFDSWVAPNSTLGSHSPTQPPMAGSPVVKGDESFGLPLEVNTLGLTSFEPDLGLDLTGAKPLSTKYLFRKASERVARYGFEIKERSRTVHTIDCEVGDDEISVNDNLLYTGLLSVFHTELGMEISEEDTSISRRYGNFCEDLLCLPGSYYQTYHNARNKSDFRDMSYIDICKLRLAIDIRPMRMNHSATNDGKASMVGKRQFWIPPGRAGIRYEVFSLFQDVNLGLLRDGKFAYLPESLGGYGKRVPFGTGSNLERFIKSFRQGFHSRTVRSIILRLMSWYGQFKAGNNPDADPLLSFVSRFTSGYHDWIKGQSIYAPVSWIGVPAEVARYKSRLNPRIPLERDVISRLLAEGYLIPESKVQIVHEHNEFCQELLGKTNVLEVRERITEKRREWLRNSSIFSMEAYGYIKEISLMNEGHRPLLDIEGQAFLKLIDDQSMFNLKLQLRNEPVYDRRVLDDLYSRGPMKVRFTIYPRYLGHTLFAHQDFRSNVIDTEELGQAQAIYEWLESGEGGTPPRKLLNDDNFIIQEMIDSRERYHCIVTEDIQLCKLANRRTGYPVFRIPVEWYYRHLYFGEAQNFPWASLLAGLTSREWETHLDDGSIRSFEECYFIDGMPSKKKIRQRFSYFDENNSTPIEVEELTDYSDDPPDIPIVLLLHDYFNELRLLRSKLRAK